MEYLLLGIGILAGILALALLGYLARMLWQFGKYLKIKVPALWYIYSGFWILLLLIVLVAIFGSAVNFYNQERANKAKHAFLDTNSKLIDRAAKDLADLTYQEDSIYIDERLQDLEKCIPSYSQLKQLKTNNFYFDANYAVVDRANKLKEDSVPWNNLNDEDQLKITLKELDCDKTLGKLTSDQYNSRKTHYLTTPITIDKYEVEKEIQNLKNQGFSDKAIMRELLANKDFGETLRYMVKDYEIDGSPNPVYAVGRMLDLNSTSDIPRVNEVEMKQRLKTMDERAEKLRLSIETLDTTPRPDYSIAQPAPAPEVTINRPQPTLGPEVETLEYDNE